jgi:hypothetical protein
MTKHQIIDYRTLLSHGIPAFDCSTGHPDAMDPTHTRDSAPDTAA